MGKERSSQGPTVAAVDSVDAVDAVTAVVAVAAEKIVAVSLVSACSSSESTTLLPEYESICSESCRPGLHDSDVRSAIPRIALGEVDFAR